MDVFDVSLNVLRPSSGKPVTITVEYSRFPGNYSLVIFNSAGEHIKTLDDHVLDRPVSAVYQWDGKNKYGETCASGVYILDLVEPYDRKERKILIVK